MMNMLMCPECIARGDGGTDIPHCAFPTGSSFVQTNYNCATMNKLRDLCDRIHNKPDGIIWGWQYRDDLDAASFSVLRVPGSDSDPSRVGFYIAMSWYKNPKRVENAVSFSRDTASKLTLDEAEYAIKTLTERVR